MADEQSADTPDDLIERQLRFLTEGGPEPDLSGLSPNEAAEARQILEVIDALLNSGPSEVHLAHDPVAIRLGLVDPPVGQPMSSSADDPVTEAVREAEHRFSFVASPAATDGTEFERRFECRSMVEHVLVVVAPDPTLHGLNAAHARSAFAMSDELSAVVYCTAAATDAIVLTYGDCHDKLEPGSGWLAAGDRFAAEPLALALRHYFERSDPRWDAVRSLDGLDTWDGLAEDVAATVDAVRQGLAATKARLPHKKTARDFVLAQPAALLSEWAVRVQNGEVDASTLASEIRALVEEGIR